jgi:hypothetical protein
METRVSLLEQVARTTTASLERIERRLEMQAAAQRADFRRLLGVILAGFATMLGAYRALPGAMADGFHWL